MLNKTTMNKTLLMMVCVAMSCALPGCRSMPGRNMFGFRSQPSAEALAGNGPTTTYPAPPSDSATPEAIASIAGGTAAPSKGPVTKTATNAQVAGVDISPGYATPTSNVQPTNMAAAQANGIYSESTDTNKAVTTASGYTFGSKALTPKSELPTSTEPPNPEPSSYAGGTSYGGGSSYPTPNQELKTPSTSYATPTASSYATRDIPPSARDIAVPGTTVSAPNPSSVDASPQSGGYTMPTDSPAVAAIKSPTSKVGGTTAEPTNAFAPPAAISPDFSTASTKDTITAPAPKVAPASISVDGGGYMPGSTSANHGYPTGEVESTSDGSFYR